MLIIGQKKVFFLPKNVTVLTIKTSICENCNKMAKKAAKKELLNTLIEMFAKEKVLDMTQICGILNTTARMTAFRSLQKLHCLTSYTHSGKYYVLPETVKFDANGFWYFGDIGFSIHGTLVNTLYHVITASESGKSSSELERYCRTQVQDALRSLLQTKKVARAKPAKPCLYVSADPVISDLQIRKREKVGPRQRLSDWIVAEILIETIRSSSVIPSIDEVTRRLSKRGSSITKEQVQQVFEEHELEKKLWINCHSTVQNLS